MNDREELIAKIEALQGITIDMFTTTSAERIADFITEQTRLARVDERRTFRRLWDDLGIALGASAGSATGATVKNDFGESWDFQLDRDAVNALFKYLNTAQLAPKPEKGKPHESK